MINFVSMAVSAAQDNLPSRKRRAPQIPAVRVVVILTVGKALSCGSFPRCRMSGKKREVPTTDAAPAKRSSTVVPLLTGNASASPISLLPVDVLTLIFACIPHHARFLSLSFVCRLWRRAVLRSISFMKLCRETQLRTFGLFPTLTHLNLKGQSVSTSLRHLVLPSLRFLKLHFGDESLLGAISEFLANHATQLDSLAVVCVWFSGMEEHSSAALCKLNFPRLQTLELCGAWLVNSTCWLKVVPSLTSLKTRDWPVLHRFSTDAILQAGMAHSEGLKKLPKLRSIYFTSFPQFFDVLQAQLTHLTVIELCRYATLNPFPQGHCQRLSQHITLSPNHDILPPPASLAALKSIDLGTFASAWQWRDALMRLQWLLEHTSSPSIKRLTLYVTPGPASSAEECITLALQYGIQSISIQGDKNLEFDCRVEQLAKFGWLRK